MREIYTIADLNAAIEAIEAQQAEEGEQLKQQFRLTYESVKPVNLIKNIFKEAAESSDLKTNILNTVAGLVMGIVSKKVFVNLSSSPVKRLLGNAILFGVTNLVAKNPRIVNSWLDAILVRIRKKPSEDSDESCRFQKEENLFI